MKNDFKEILKIIFTGICLFSIFFFVNYFNNNKNDNSKFLKKYTYNPTQKYSNVFNIEHKFINIEQKDYENLFDAGYVKFKNIEGDYTFVSGKDENTSFDMNLYQSSTGINLAVWLENDIYNSITEKDFSDLLLDDFKKTFPDVNLTQTLKRNKIENKLDLIFAVFKNLNIEVDKKSTKNQIIDNFTLDYLLPVVVPYDSDSEVNRIILFTGAQNGYVYIKNDTVYIFIKKETQEIRIIYKASDNQRINIDEAKIIDIISSIKY